LSHGAHCARTLDYKRYKPHLFPGITINLYFQIVCNRLNDFDVVYFATRNWPDKTFRRGRINRMREGIQEMVGSIGFMDGDGRSLKRPFNLDGLAKSRHPGEGRGPVLL
jgi:hypothetical protein